MIETITAVNQAVNQFIWGVPAMVCIIGVGLLLSVRTGFLQIRKFPYAIKTTIGRMFHKKDASDGAMTPFQAVCTALAGTVGTGNIAGVAGAIAIGGPGAVFWMWCSALLGMCTKFAEVTLAVHYRCLLYTSVADNDRQGVQSGKLCSVLTAVPGDDLIATFRAWAGDQRRQHAVLLYAFHRALHGLVIQNLKGMILERKQLSDGNLLNLFPLLLLSGFFGGEDVICPFQRHEMCIRDRLYILLLACIPSFPLELLWLSS